MIHECSGQTHYRRMNKTISVSRKFCLSDSVRRSITKSWSIKKQEHEIQIIMIFFDEKLENNVTEHLLLNVDLSINDTLSKYSTVNITKKAGWYVQNITQLTNLRPSSQNTIKVTWPRVPYEYMVGVFVAQKLTWSKLLVELTKRPVRPYEKTKESIKTTTENESDMGAYHFEVTIQDPLSRQRMQLPVRGKDCIHLECFDGVQFLQMNEIRYDKWTCPLCRKEIKFASIEVDDFFLKILQDPNLSEECKSIVLLKDGSWTEKKPETQVNNTQSTDVTVISSDDENSL